MLAALALGACARADAPAPVVDHGRPILTQQFFARSTTTTVTAPAAAGAPAAAPVTPVAVQSVAVARPEDAPPAPARRSRPAEVAALPPPAAPNRGGVVVRDKPAPAATASRGAPAGRLRELPPRDAAGFLMPVEGRIVSEFGPKGNGLQNDGINIAAPRGTPVRAAEAGVVAYAGEEIRGFGRLLLLRHADGFITAYAHNERLLVKRGEVVDRGQAIATVGATGGIDAPQLHFEIRLGTRPVDPRAYIAAARPAVRPTAGDPGARPGPG